MNESLTKALKEAIEERPHGSTSAYKVRRKIMRLGGPKARRYHQRKPNSSMNHKHGLAGKIKCFARNLQRSETQKHK